MRTVEAIPVATVPSPPASTSVLDALRAAAGPDREVLDGSIIRSVDQAELVHRESLRTLDYWASLALNNARHPAASPAPYWSVIETANRRAAQTDAREQSREMSEPAAPGRRNAAGRSEPSHTDPALALGKPSPTNKAPQRTMTKVRYQMVVQRYAATGRLVDLMA